ncbi:MAG: MGMT family protein [Sumerlaeia bacterium]
MLDGSVFKTPFGEGLVASREGAIVALWLPPLTMGQANAALEKATRPGERFRFVRTRESLELADLLAKACDGSGCFEDLRERMVWPELTPFAREVSEACAAIPRGEVRSYGQLAKAVGNPKGSRAIGGVMARNPLPLLIPCHRVVRSDGSLGNYGGGLEMKRWLLEREGVAIDAAGRTVLPAV